MREYTISAGRHSVDSGANSFVHNELRDLHWIIEHSKYKWKRRLCFAITSHYFNDEILDAMLIEILTYKWIKCEQAGKDLYGDGDQGIIAAGTEWFKHYRDEFLATHNYQVRYVKKNE